MAVFAEGVPCWVGCELPDLAAGRRFYGALLGWTFHEGPWGGPGHSQAYVDHQPAASLTQKRDGRTPTTWTVSFATPDIQALTARVTAAGGTVPYTPQPVGDLGVRALAADPGGAVLGLWQPGRHKGFRVTRAPGAYGWSEVHTRDAARVDPFYEQVFGYTGHEPPALRGLRLWSPEDTEPGPDTAVLGREVMDAAVPAALPAHLLPYFRVEDCAGAARHAVRLGGTLRAGPGPTAYGTCATLTDDQGALFAVLAE